MKKQTFIAINDFHVNLGPGANHVNLGPGLSVNNTGWGVRTQTDTQTNTETHNIRMDFTRIHMYMNFTKAQI